jgi:hypothetical protein
MKSMYVTLSVNLLAAIVMLVPAYPAVPTAGASEELVGSRPTSAFEVGSRPTSAEGDLKLALECSVGPYSDPDYGQGLAIYCW